MNVLKQTFSRAKQSLEEQFGDASKTEYDAEMTRLLRKADDVKEFSERILNSMEIYLQPDPAIRILPGLTQEGLMKAESVGHEMISLSSSLGNKTDTGAALAIAGEAFNEIGRNEKEFLAAANQIYINPMRRFLQEDLKLLDQERKVLTNRRLDMDVLKTKAHKNTTDTGLLAEVGKAQMGFDEQMEKVKDLIKKLDAHLTEMQQHLKHFVLRQSEYFNKCRQTFDDLAKKL